MLCTPVTTVPVSVGVVIVAVVFIPETSLAVQLIEHPDIVYEEFNGYEIGKEDFVMKGFIVSINAMDRKVDAEYLPEDGEFIANYNFTGKHEYLNQYQKFAAKTLMSFRQDVRFKEVKEDEAINEKDIIKTSVSEFPLEKRPKGHCPYKGICYNRENDCDYVHPHNPCYNEGKCTLSDEKHLNMFSHPMTFPDKEKVCNKGKTCPLNHAAHWNKYQHFNPPYFGDLCVPVDKVCPKYIKGICHYRDKCYFLHPPCKHFLKGECTNKQCNYEHILPSSSREEELRNNAEELLRVAIVAEERLLELEAEKAKVEAEKAEVEARLNEQEERFSLKKEVCGGWRNCGVCHTRDVCGGAHPKLCKVFMGEGKCYDGDVCESFHPHYNKPKASSSFRGGGGGGGGGERGGRGGGRDSKLEPKFSSSSTSKPSKKVCVNFTTADGCKFGNACRFSHSS